MQKKKICKCGSRDVVYVIQRGRGKKIEMYCAKCLPVEPVQGTVNSKEETMGGEVPVSMHH
jgi:hypothetical protein